MPPRPRPTKTTRIIICANCNGYGKTFGITRALTCLQCGGGGLLKIIDDRLVRKMTFIVVEDCNWYDTDFTGEHRSRSLERNGVITFTDINLDGDAILDES